MLKRLLRHPFVLAALGTVAGYTLRLILATIRWRVEGAEHLAAPLAGRPIIAAFWHECLPLMPALWQHTRRTGAPGAGAVLVSRHADGRLIGLALRAFDMGVVHGSTARAGRSRGGAAGLRGLLDVLAAGGIAVLTPDGPRGPRRIPAPGVAQLAAVSGCPVLPCAAQVSRHRRLGSWDRMIVPLPFSRGVLVCGPPIAVAENGAEAALVRIADALADVAGRAQVLCGPAS